ncbi:MAG: energy-coupling factor transporter transmembrane component T family protein, partial [Chloroflexia bacterium]
VPLRYALRSLVPLWPLFLILLAFQLLFYPHRQAVIDGGPALWQAGRFVVSWAGMRAFAGLSVRMVALVLLLTLLTTIADATDLVHAVEALLRPLQRAGFPAHELALVFVVALRFLPLLVREAERLLKAQAARGADFGRGGVIQRVRRTFPLLIPLFVITLRRAEELAIAMEARGYVGGRGRSHFVRLRMRPRDWLALATAAGIALALLRLDLRPLEQAIFAF